MTCEEVRLALGAHALGALDEGEAEEVDLHLATCEACGGELEELAGVAGFLGKVSERDVELVADPPRRVLDRLLSERAGRRRRGRLLMAVAAAAAVVGVGGVVWSALPQEAATQAAAPAERSSGQEMDTFGAEDADAARSRIGDDVTVAPEDAPTSTASARENTTDEPTGTADEPESGADEPTRSAAPPESVATPFAQGRAFEGADEAAGHRATVTAVPDGPRTDLTVRVEGVPVGTECTLVIVGRDGSRETAGPWTIHRETYEENTVFRHETETPIGGVAAFEIAGPGGEVLVRVPVTAK